jgi:type II secretion system protein C
MKLADVGAAGPNAQQLGALGEAIKTALDLKIGSTLRIGDGTDKRSSAYVAVGKTKGKAYFVGDEESFAPDVKLIKVRRRRIEFINSGRLEYAELDEFKKSVFVSAEEAFGNVPLLASASYKNKPMATNTAPAGGTIQVDQSEIDNALQNLDQLQREVRIVPNFQGGKSAGFKVLAVKPGGLISKLGVRRGDVLVKVNGEDLDIRRGLELFSSLKDSRNFALEVLRGGQTQTLEYEIR